eukprot:5423714-Pyramimonas_sp.AAC.1
MQRLRQREEASVGEGRHDQARRVAQVLVAVVELGVPAVRPAVLGEGVPPVPQLTAPHVAARALNPLTHESLHHVAVVHVHRHHRHRLLPL